MREQHICMNLLFTLFDSAEKFPAAFFVVSQKRLIVDKIGSGWNGIIADISPFSAAHHNLHNLQVFSEGREHLTVFFGCHREFLRKYARHLLCLLRGGMFRRKPLGAETNGSAICHVYAVFFKLLPKHSGSIVRKGRLHKRNNDIPSCVLRYQRHKRSCCLGMVLCQIKKKRPKEPSFAKSLPDVTGKEKPLYGKKGIFIICLYKSICNFIRRSISQRRNGEIQIKQSLARSPIACGAVFGHGSVVLIIQNILKLLHESHCVFLHLQFW